MTTKIKWNTTSFDFDASLNEIKDATPPEQRLEEATTLYANLRAVIDSMDEHRKALNAIKSHLQYTFLPQLMASASLKTATLSAGRLTVTTDVRASIRKDMKEIGYAWLRDNDLDALITETVNASTLSALAKDFISHAKELPDDVFNVAVNERVSLTKVLQKG